MAQKEIEIQVGIMSAYQIRFSLHGTYFCEPFDFYFKDDDHYCFAFHGVTLDDFYSEETIIFIPQSQYAYFEIEGVTIGVGFHWQRNESQHFRGTIKFVREGDNVRVINIINVEEYLESVISSEMSATNSLELLKAHAIISRSWVLKPILERNTLSNKAIAHNTQTVYSTEDCLIKWYERDAHIGYDVCADDHCQRYQGISRISSPLVHQAIEETRSLVLKHNGQIADARFYKCCGGATELFENTWANNHYDYLIAQRDDNETALPDLTNEDNARTWITTAPKAYCNTHDRKILSQVLNNYDQETANFYRWTVQYTQAEISQLIKQKSGIDFGTITDMIPIKRGPSARIIELQIIGTKRSITVGKELEIRKWLSPTHLYSSAFIVDRNSKWDFILQGAGWGHGVGLCQIGAAMMAQQGYNYQQILSHYFPHTTIEKP